VITGDLSSTPASNVTNPGNCANNLPSSIDDLHICGRDEFIDGPGINGVNTLGSAGPLFLRTDPITNKVTTVTGQMR